MASPLLLPVIMGGLFAVVLDPTLRWLEKRKVGSKLGSALLTVGITLVLIIPTVLLLYLALKAGFAQIQRLKESAAAGPAHSLLEHPRIQAFMDFVTQWYPVNKEQLAETVQDMARGLSLKAADLLAGALGSIPGFVLGLSVMVVSIYFILVDGHRLVLFMRRNSFFGPRQTDQLLVTLERTCRSVLLASLVSGVAQALFASTVYIFAGIPNVPLLGALVLFASFIPVIGTAPVTFGVALHQFLTGHATMGVAMVVTALIVSTMDNFIRPMFLRGSVNLHPLLAFVAAFGGLQTIGFVGIFVGPVIASLFVVTMQILSQGPESADIQV